MSVSAGMKTALASNVVWLCEVWKMEASDGTVAAYTSHTRPLTYQSQLYAVAPFEPSRASRKIGLDPDSFEVTGAFDGQVTKADIAAGLWDRAKITRQLVDYTDLSLLYAMKQVGFAGVITVVGDQFTIECLSLSSALQQEIGDVTTGLDRHKTILELTGSEASVTHSATVGTVTSNQVFETDFTPIGAQQLKYGRVIFTSGSNTDLEMEIKSVSGTEITLQLPMPSDVAAGDTVDIVEGYDGTRAEAVRLAGDAENMNCEPDLPSLKALIKYPTA